MVLRAHFVRENIVAIERGAFSAGSVKVIYTLVNWYCICNVCCVEKKHNNLSAAFTNINATSVEYN